MDRQTRDMTIWGIGKTMSLVTIAYAVPAGVLSLAYPHVLAPRFLPTPVGVWIGVVLILLGIAMLAASGRAIVTAFRQDKLLTTGIYGLVRNPIYSAWIVFICPGIVFVSQWWLLLGASIVAYVYFKLTIGKEREYLVDVFGQEYVDYECRVNEMIPWPRRGGQRQAVRQSKVGQ